MSLDSSQLSRYRLAVIALTGFAAAYGCLAIYSASRNGSNTASLRRSNAVRRAQRHTISIVQHRASPEHPLGVVTITAESGGQLVLDLLNDSIPTRSQLSQVFDGPSITGRNLYPEIVENAVHTLLDASTTTFRPGDDEDATVTEELRALCEIILDLDEHQVTEERIEPIAEFLGVQDLSLVRRAICSHSRQLQVQEMEVASGNDVKPSGHELKGLLYYVAEEQAKRKAYQHRGVRCEYCGESPIRDIRWHCLNCPDFDLCSSCKASTAHQRNHVFAEIRIPLPVLAQPIGILPPWYTGDTDAAGTSPPTAYKKQFCQQYALECEEIDALYDQFTCIANLPPPGDPLNIGGIGAAIDRRGFYNALTSGRWRSRLRPNILYDRMFAFYDHGKQGRIGFEEFVSGITYLRGDKRFQPLRRALQGFDLDEDGFLCRSDFLRLLKAKYEVHRLMIEDIAESEEIGQTQHALGLLQSSQPVSSAFHEEIPLTRPRPLTGKSLNRYGDLIPSAGANSILADGEDQHPRTQQQNSNGLEAGSDQLTEDEREILGLSSPYKTRVHRHRLADQIILWQIIEQGLNEVLDIVFQDVEQRFGNIAKTTSERVNWRSEIDKYVEDELAFVQQLEAESPSDPLMATARQSYQNDTNEPNEDENFISLRQSLRSGMVATDTASLEQMEHEIAERALPDLLRSTGYAVVAEGKHDAEDGVQSSNEQETLVDQGPSDDFSLSKGHDASIQGSTEPTSESSNGKTGDDQAERLSDCTDETKDPTMPQNKPNRDSSIAQHLQEATLHKADGLPPERASKPSRTRLKYLAGVDRDQREIQTRGGSPCLSLEQIEILAEVDRTGEVSGLIKSWLEWASF